MSNEFSPKALIGSETQCAQDGYQPTPDEQVAAYFESSPSALVPSQSSKNCITEDATASPGFTLPSGFDDPAFCDENVTLLGRIKKKLVAFKGSGFIELVEGKAKLVDTIPNRVSQLKHKFTKVAGGLVLGKPETVPFLAVVDETREVHAIGGLTSGKSVFVHDHNKGGWNVTPLGEVPKEQVGRIPEVSTIQLTGYRPENTIAPCNGELGPETRTLEALGGVGLVVVGQVPAPTDECGDKLQSVATVLPNPPSEGQHTLKFKDGKFVWVEDTKPTLPDLPTGEGCFRLETCGQGLTWVPKSPELPPLPDISDCEPKCYVPQYCGTSITWTPTGDTSLSGDLLGNG